MRHQLISVAVIAVTLMALNACKKEDTFKPSAGIKNTDWHSVSASGGTIEVNDITIEFPSGAFDSDSKVAVTPVKKGSVKNASGRELSEFYQLVFPKEGVQKPFTISINYDGDVQRVHMIEESVKRDRYTWKSGLHTAALAAEKSDGIVSTAVPGIDPTDGDQPFFTIGLVDGTASAVPSTKADGTTLHYTIDWCIPTEKDIKKYEPYREEILAIVRQELKTVHTVFVNQGIKLSSSPVPYVLIPGGGKWGQHVTDNVRKDYGIIELNTDSFVSMLKEGKPYHKDLYAQLQQTMLHETYHWIQDVVYDPRFCTALNAAGHSEWTMFSEAMATYLEKFTGNYRISENCPYNAEYIVRDFFCSNGTDFENTGYGMGLFLQWLSVKKGEKKIVKLLDYLKDNGGWFTNPSLRSDYDAFAKENNLKFFNPYDDWYKFTWEVLAGKVDNRVNGASFGISNQIRMKQAMTESKGPVCDFGFAVQNIVPETAVLNMYKSNPALSFAIFQENEDLKTWLCDASFGKVGYAEKDKPYAISSNDFLNKSKQWYLVTERKKQDTGVKDIRSEVSAQVIPWPVFVAFERGGYDGYYDWSGGEIKCKWTGNGYYVECAYPHGSLAHFYIGYVNNRFTDITNLFFDVEYDHGRRMEMGRLKLDYSQVSSTDKFLRWKGTYKGEQVTMEIRLL